MAREPMLNLANRITLVRIVLIPVFMVFLLSRDVLDFFTIPLRWGAVIAGVIFVVAAVTDTIDGYVARTRGQETTFGALLDPLADKLLIAAAAISLVDLNRLSAWIAMVIISREFAVTGLRMTAALEHVVIPASRWGKMKTLSQVVAITFVIVRPPIGRFEAGVEGVLLGIAVVLTIASGFDYFSRVWQTLLSRTKGDQGEE